MFLLALTCNYYLLPHGDLRSILKSLITCNQHSYMYVDVVLSATGQLYYHTGSFSGVSWTKVKGAAETQSPFRLHQSLGQNPVHHT